MVTLRGEGYKKIEYTLNDMIHECDKEMYMVEMPLLICNSKKDMDLILLKLMKLF